MQDMEIKENNIGKSIQLYVNHIKAKKNFMTLSLVPPIMRKGKNNTQENN